MVVQVLSALAEPTRLEVVRLLWEHGELCACQLMPRLGATQSRISRHLQVLKQAGLVVDRRDAQRVLYRPNPKLAPDVKAIVDAVIVAQAQARRRVA